MHKNTIRKLLNIPGYKVNKIISKTEQEIHLEVIAYKRKKAICSNCGEVHAVGFHGSSKVLVEDLSLCGRRTFLYVIKRRFLCSKDDRIHNEEIPWLKKRSRVTKRFAEHVGRLTAITTNQEAGWFLGLDDEKVYRID